MLHRMLVYSTVTYDSEIDSLPKVINMVATAFEREILRKNMQAHAGQQGVENWIQ